jgi:hypothetical protein
MSKPSQPEWRAQELWTMRGDRRMLAPGIVRVNSTSLRHMPLTSSCNDVGCATLEANWRGLGWEEQSSTNQKQGREGNHGHR